MLGLSAWYTAHRDFAWAVVAMNLAVGLWALAAERVRGLRHRFLWRATAVAEIAFFVQVTLGVILMNVDDLEPSDMHMLYGFSSLMAIGIMYSYRKNTPWVAENRFLVYGGFGLFLVGLALRNIFM